MCLRPQGVRVWAVAHINNPTTRPELAMFPSSMAFHWTVLNVSFHLARSGFLSSVQILQYTVSLDALPYHFSESEWASGLYNLGVASVALFSTLA